MRAHPALAARYGVLTMARTACNVMAAQYTPAYNVALVFSVSPFVTALVARACVGERLPRAMWPALVGAVAGAALVVAAQSPLLASAPGGAGAGAGAPALGRADAVGMALTFAGVTAQACVRVEMTRSAGRLARKELLVVQYAGATLPFAALTLAPGSPLALGGDAWAPWAALDAAAWRAFGLFVVLCMWFAAEYQVSLDARSSSRRRSLSLSGLTASRPRARVGALRSAPLPAPQVACVRALGPAFTAAFQPLRLLSTVAASALWLREPVRGAAEWLGLTLVLGSMSAYLLYDMVCRPRAARARTARPRAASTTAMTVPRSARRPRRAPSTRSRRF